MPLKQSAVKFAVVIKNEKNFFNCRMAQIGDG